MTLLEFGLIMLAVAIATHPYATYYSTRALEVIRHRHVLEKIEQARRSNESSMKAQAEMVERSNRSHAELLERAHRLREGDEPWK